MRNSSSETSLPPRWIFYPQQQIGSLMLLVLLGVCLFLPRPTSAQSLRATEVWDTAGETKLIAIGSMSMASDTSIWISDPRAGMVYSLQTDGTGIHPIVRSGNGPGEVKSPSLIARTPDDGVAILDLSRRSIEVFASDLSFEQRIPLELRITNPKGFAVSPEGNFIVSGGAYGKDRSVYRFGSNGEVTGRWMNAPDTENPRAGVMTAGGPLHIGSDGAIFFSRSAPHEIYRISPGETPKELVSSPGLIENPGDDFITETGSGENLVRRFAWNYPQSDALFQLERGRILNVIRFEEQERSLWQVYEPDGTLVVQSEIDRAYEVWDRMPSGDLLASFEAPDSGEHVAVRLRLSFE